jgi:hypothetical protein
VGASLSAAVPKPCVPALGCRPKSAAHEAGHMTLIVVESWRDDDDDDVIRIGDENGRETRKNTQPGEVSQVF